MCWGSSRRENLHHCKRCNAAPVRNQCCKEVLARQENKWASLESGSSEVTTEKAGSGWFRCLSASFNCRKSSASWLMVILGLYEIHWVSSYGVKESTHEISLHCIFYNLYTSIIFIKISIFLGIIFHHCSLSCWVNHSLTRSTNSDPEWMSCVKDVRASSFLLWPGKSLDLCY